MTLRVAGCFPVNDSKQVLPFSLSLRLEQESDVVLRLQCEGSQFTVFQLSYGKYRLLVIQSFFGGSR